MAEQVEASGHHNSSPELLSHHITYQPLADIAPTVLLSYLLAAATYLWTDLAKKRSVPEPKKRYDYVIVGGGSAGAIIAARLSEDPHVDVLLLEAGGSAGKVAEIPYLYKEMRTLKDTFVREYTTVPQKFICGSMDKTECVIAVGRVLGGSSVVNSLLYTRGNRWDFEDWGDMGAKNWTFDDVLPYFIRNEDNHELGPSQLHGKAGPIGVSTKQWPAYDEFTLRWLHAAEELNLEIGDYNGNEQARFSPPQRTIRQGLRQSTDRSYIKPIEAARKNLDISLLSTATKIIFDEKKAVGVEFTRDGKKNKVYVNREIVLSASTFATPQLLILSGIGPKEQLDMLMVRPVVAQLPVGQNLHDHVRCILEYTSNVTFPENYEINEENFDLWKKTGTGIFGTNDIVGIGFVYAKSSKYKDDTIGQVSVAITPGTKEMSDDVLTKFRFAAILNKPRSRGTLELKSVDLAEAPTINGNYLAEHEDREDMLDILVKVVELTETAAYQEISLKFVVPDLPKCHKWTPLTRDYLACYARYMCQPDYPVGTVRMGSKQDPRSVVDERLRVIGVTGLRVADASIMPNIVRGNLNAATMMIGERAADLIKEDWH